MARVIIRTGADVYAAARTAQDLKTLLVDQHVFDHLLREKFPSVAEHLTRLGVASSAVTAHWFLTVQQRTPHRRVGVDIEQARDARLLVASSGPVRGHMHHTIALTECPHTDNDHLHPIVLARLAISP